MHLSRATSALEHLVCLELGAIAGDSFKSTFPIRRDIIVISLKVYRPRVVTCPTSRPLPSIVTRQSLATQINTMLYELGGSGTATVTMDLSTYLSQSRDSY
jgi:hypothetical protein